MRIVVTLVSEIPDRDVSVKSIEQASLAAWREFPSRFWREAVRAVEARALAQHPPGRRTVKCWEERTLLTAAGPVTFRRRRFSDEAEERSFLLFDMRVGLAPYQRTTAAAERLLAETAAEASYAQSARFLERLWGGGEGPSPMKVWTATQRVGGELRERAEALHRAVFVDGELPGWECPAPEFVGVEADSTFLPVWRDRDRDTEVFVGISYTGKEVLHGRRRLKGRAVSVGLSGAARFGREFFASTQERQNVVEAESGVFISDGDSRLRAIQEEHFPQLVRQADRAHVTRRVREAYGRERQGQASESLRRLDEGKVEEVCRALRRDARRWRSRAEKLEEAAGYLERLGEDLYAARRLRESGAPVPEHMEGSGGIERQIGVLVAQRMKRRGMSWTRRGAENLLAVRQELLDRLAA